MNTKFDSQLDFSDRFYSYIVHTVHLKISGVSLGLRVRAMTNIGIICRLMITFIAFILCFVVQRRNDYKWL